LPLFAGIATCCLVHAVLVISNIACFAQFHRAKLVNFVGSNCVCGNPAVLASVLKSSHVQHSS
jgi:hypothetical protein